jgi:hypothetical protein
MANWSLREGVELFHLAFLGELGTKLDKSRYALKGGCNLRFFFKSVRYSEDIDLDVGSVPVTTLGKNVARVLGSRSLALTLRAAGIVLRSVSAPKQAEITQHWKVLLEVSGAPAPTKIEFSRRRLDDGRELGPADPMLIARYGLSPLLCSHYDREAALLQKFRALIDRTETQARDIFDLDLLLAGSTTLPRLTREKRAAIIERASSVDADAFRAQVVAFLAPEQQRLYAVPSVWTEMVNRVIAAARAEGP